VKDSFDPSQAFPFQRHGVCRIYVSSLKRERVVGAVVYRYKTAEDRANHLVEERRVLEKR
jgi:hypothetical protein